MAKGKLPVTGFMEIQSGTDQWSMLDRGLINEFKTNAILTTQDSRKVKIGLLIISITPPNKKSWENRSHVELEGRGRDELCIGFEKTQKFIMDFITAQSWTLIGYIDGETKIPVIIEYLEKLNLTVYTQKTEDQTQEQFFPKGFNPGLN
jgi:hypothetical protein